MASETFRVGDRVQLIDGGFGVLTSHEDYGNEVCIRVNGPLYGFDTVVYRSQIRHVPAESEAMAGVEGELGDWERGVSGAWSRRGPSPFGEHVHVHERDVFRVFVCGTLLGERFTCPDAAREAADAHLVSQGRLPAERAFVRLGEWEPSAPKGYWARVGSGDGLVAMGHEREGADAAAVKLGILDPSRAFKATTENTPNTMTRIPPEKHNSEPPEVARAAKPAWSHNGSTQTTVMPLGGSSYTIPTGYSPEHVASKINADPNAPVTATVKHGAISLERRAFGPAPAWGEWERIGDMYVRGAPNGRTSAYADGDTWVVRRGLLAEERAFKVAKVDDKYKAFGMTRAEYGAAVAEEFRTYDGADETVDMFKKYTWDAPSAVVRTYTLGPSAPGACEVSHDDGVTWEQAQAGVTLGPKSRLRYKASAEPTATVAKTAIGIDYASAHGDASTTVVVNKRADGVNEVVGYAHNIAKMSDDEINAMYGKNSDVARTLILAKRSAVHAVANLDNASNPPAIGHTVRMNRPVTDHTEVTVATWEHHLPTLLDNAPREFRDGFNRRRGPAWESYLVALAGVKEQIQCKRFVGPSALADVVRVAAGRARYAMGVEWALANTKRETE